ncbi:hypothetical protein TNCV_499271 [Trichonephila clavipes]|nr:hypothetical protein TNCV_499271 [Trichonephila clavipes]
MRASNFYAHPNIRDHWALRCMNRCPDLVVYLNRDLQCLRPQASLVLIYRPNVAGMKGRVDLAQPVNRTQDLWCGSTMHYHSTLLGSPERINRFHIEVYGESMIGRRTIRIANITLERIMFVNRSPTVIFQDSIDSTPHRFEIRSAARWSYNKN